MRYTYEQPEYLDRVGVVHLVKQLKIYIDGIATGDIDLSDYVTKAELQAKLDALDINIDLSAYATKEELTNALSNIDLSAYATKEYVTNAINNAQLGGDGSSVDLSIYAKKSDLDSKADTEHTHTMSDITDYTAPDLSSYAKKTDIPSLSGYATKTYVDQNKFSGSYNDLTDKPTIPSTDGLATTEYVDNGVANIPTGGNVELSNYYTKEETYTQDEIDGLIENNKNKAAYEVYLDSRAYRYAPINETTIYGEDGIYTATVIEDAEVGSYNKYEPSNEYIRCDYSALKSMLNAIVDEGYDYTTMVWYVRFNGKNEEYSLNKEDFYNGHGYPVGLTYHNEPCVDLAYCGSISPSPNGTKVYPSYNKGDYFYRFIRINLYDKEVADNHKVWIPYFAYVTDDNGTIKYQKIEEVYMKNRKGLYTPVTALKTVSKEHAKPVRLPSIQGYDTHTTYQTQLNKAYKNFLLFLINPYLTKEEWLETLKGADGVDGTVSFDTLTDEQKASLKGEKGDKGDKGDIGETGANGQNGADGQDGQDGQDGRGIVSTKFLYGYSSTPNTVPTSWSDTDSNLLLGEYRWVKVEITYSDNTTETNYISYVYNGKDGTNGTNGTNGTDGHTPVRGTDYWTQEDINTIKAYIDTELGVIENGSY